MKEHPKYSSNDPKPYVLYPREMVAVSSITCIVVKNKRQHYPLISIPVMYNMIGEPTSLKIQSFNSTADSIRVSVTTVIPSFVWCEAFSDLSYVPTVREVMYGKQFYSVSGVVAEVGSLLPEREYRVFCYAESVAHVTMKERLVDCSFKTTTQKAEYAYDSWNEENGMLQFSIKTNIDSPFACSLMRKKQVFPVSRMGNVFSISHSGPCLVKCFVSFGDTVFSMNEQCKGETELNEVAASDKNPIPCNQPVPTCRPAPTCKPAPPCDPVPCSQRSPTNQPVPTNVPIPTDIPTPTEPSNPSNITIYSILSSHEAIPSSVYSTVFVLGSVILLVVVLLRRRRFRYTRLSNTADV